MNIFKNKIILKSIFFLCLILGIIFFGKYHALATTDCPNPSSGCYCYPRHVTVTYKTCSGNKITSASFKWDGSNCGFYVFNFYSGNSSSYTQIGSDNLGHPSTGYENYTLNGINASTPLGVGTKDPLRSAPQITFDTSPTNNCTPPPTSTPTLTPTSTPTPTPSGPTATPTITPTPTPIFTTGDITVHYEGIDQDNTPLPGGQNHSTRHIILFLYKDDPNGVDFGKTTPTYVLPAGTVQLQSNDTGAPDYGFFRNKNFPMKGVASGNYYILVKATEGSLVEEIGNGLIPIVGGQNNILVNINGNSDNQNLPTQPPFLHMGDIVTDCSSPSSCSYNTIDPLDYNALKDCFGPNITSQNCLNHHLGDGHDYNIADINDYSGVDGVDYTILLKNFGHTGVGGTTQNGGKNH